MEMPIGGIFRTIILICFPVKLRGLDMGKRTEAEELRQKLYMTKGMWN